ncbi:hypothetical protein sos41_02710 [Alphaproteobacteria bacterium SO-S41]|nr:hypothetical protein sos41_02710 [Alphaproteobacteria bacterium SO-S41]
MWTGVFCIVLVTVLGLRHRIQAWLDAREARKLAFRAEQERQAGDPLAHFYLTVAEINEKTPPPETFERFERTIWRFENKNYLNAEGADEARRQAVLRDARAFYQDVDRLRLGRG